MSSVRPDDKASDIPEKLVDANTRTTYKRLRFFGKVNVLNKSQEIYISM